jgi:hypothetical protein
MNEQAKQGYGDYRRTKGRNGEREVANIWRAAGLEVRGLEGSGDHLVIGGPVTVHSEVKRQERLKLPEWLRQAAAEAPSGTIAVVSFRQNIGNFGYRDPNKVTDWYSCLPTVDLAELIAR